MNWWKTIKKLDDFARPNTLTSSSLFCDLSFSKIKTPDIFNKNTY